MKKERIDLKLKYKNGQEIFSVRNSSEPMDVDTMLRILRNGIKTKEIASGGKVIDNNNIKYNFYVYEYDEKTGKQRKNIISIRVSHADAKQFHRILDTLDDLVEISASIKKVNRNRILAGIACSLVLVSTFGSSVVHFIGQKLEEDSQFSMHGAPSSYSTMSEEEQKEKYYEEIVERYENGDETVKEEYQRYCMEKSIMEALENSQGRTL